MWLLQVAVKADKICAATRAKSWTKAPSTHIIHANDDVLAIPLSPPHLPALDPFTPHTQLLQEAVDADEPVVPYDKLDQGAKQIISDVMQRQALVASGALDLENGLDDFRVVLGKSGL